MNIRNPPAWLVGLAGFALASALVLQVLRAYDMDPTVFVGFGDGSRVQSSYAEQQLGSVTTRPRFAHDGKYFFIQANDPFYLEPERHAAVLDRPLYRAQRMLFPLIAGGFGLLPPRLIAWSLAITNVLALAAGAIVAARLARLWGISTWFGLWVPLNIGLIFELVIGGAGILAFVACLAGVYALATGRTIVASAMFTGASLSREVMIIFAAGVFILLWRKERQLLWPIVVAPLVAVAAWNAYLRIRLSGIAGVGGGWPIFAEPFAGLSAAFRAWLHDPHDLIVNVAMVVIVVAFIPLALRSSSPLAWGALPFAALATVLSVSVWREWFDLSRALAPIFTAAPFVIAVARHDRLLALVDATPRGITIVRPRTGVEWQGGSGSPQG